MARQLIVCCDGTNNNLTGRCKDTNVAQLVELLAPDSQDQLLYYDPGVGSAGELPEASPWDRLRQRVQRLSSIAYGGGIYENIAQAYRFLMRHWQPGDQIFLYGFSRGAFTARSVGGLVTQFGILRPEMEALVPTLVYVYFLDRDKYKSSYDSIRAQISELFACEAARVAPVWFVGVWDTVASVGAPLLSREITALPTIVGKRFMHVRQALALDEFRRNFRPRPYFIDASYDYAAHQQSIKQEWFSGAHCDVGGGVANSQAGLPQQALLWLVQESAERQLRLRPEVLDAQGQPDPIKVAAFLAERTGLAGAPEKLVHSQPYDTPWWALAGLEVRDPHGPQHLTVEQSVRAAIAPVESPTVAANALRYPDDTVWRQRRALWPVLLAALLAALLATVLADGLWGMQGALHGAPGLVLLLNFAFIAAYGYLLARAVGWAFARIARLRRVSQAAPVWLNRLGLSALLVIAGDVAHTLLTWAALLCAGNLYASMLEPVLGIAMVGATLIKWLGLAGSAVLVVWAGVAGGKTPRP